MASLGAGRALAGVVEGLLARLLVTAQDADDECSTADGDAVPPLFTNESGTDVALVAASEQRRTMSMEEASTSGLIALGASGLGELAAACHRLAAWATWGEALAAACLTGCPELSSHPGQWGPHAEVWWWVMRSGGSMPLVCSPPAWASLGLGPVRWWIMARPS